MLITIINEVMIFIRYKALDRMDADRKLLLFQHLGFVHCPIRSVTIIVIIDVIIIIIVIVLIIIIIVIVLIIIMITGSTAPPFPPARTPLLSESFQEELQQV